MNAPDSNLRPIGVFDSGVGGLTVLKAIRELMPSEDLVYLGDTARLPYGTKSPASIERYASQAVAKLQQEDIKLLVIACNTASAVALDTLSEQLLPLPVIGVVEPGAAAAVSERPGGNHLVLATEATVQLGAYRRAIEHSDPDAQVRELACEMLVSLAEEGWTTGPIAEAIVSRYLEAGQGGGFRPDSIILGCTHFPLLLPAISNVVGQDVAIVDSASTTATRVRDRLGDEQLLAGREGSGRLRLLATDGATRFARVGGRFLDAELAYSDIQIVDL
jgi:glutamate racemase